MNKIQNFKQLSDAIDENSLTEQDLLLIQKDSTDLSVKFGISGYLDDSVSARELVSEVDDISQFVEMLPFKNRSAFIDLLIERAIQLHAIENTSDAKSFMSNMPLAFDEFENSNRINFLQKAAIALIDSPSRISSNSWDKDITARYTVDEMSSYLQDYNFLINVLPIYPDYFVKNILKSESVIIENYIQAMTTKQITTEQLFDAIAFLRNNSIVGKIKIEEDLFSFEIEDGVQAALFEAFGLNCQVIENDALFTEREMGVKEVEGELFLRGNKIVGDLQSTELSTLESFKTSLFSIMSQAIATVGKVASNPKTRVALVAITAFGVLGDAWGAADSMGEGDIATVLNKLEKVHQLKGFESGKQFNALDAQLEQIGADLNDIRLTPSMDHRSINFSGEDGDYTLRIGDSKVIFEYNDDGMYEAIVKNAAGGKGIISPEALTTWAKKITMNLNKAVAAADKD